MEKIITYCGHPAKVACDEKCDKAWGSVRPRFYRELGEDKIFGYGYGNGEIWPDKELKNQDDYILLSDNELCIAPTDNGVLEGDDGKPIHSHQIPNKWCIRECERCSMSNPNKYNEPLELRDFSVRRPNIPQ